LSSFGRRRIQEIEGRAGVVAGAGDRLCDFMSQRASQFTHHAHAIHAGKIRLELTECLISLFAFGQIEHEGNAVVAALFEKYGTHEYGNAAAVLAKILLLEGLNGPR
jgi:hypothetical protein